MDDKAKAKFEQIYKDDPKNHFARAELALYKYKQDSNEDAAIGELQQVVLDAQFQNVRPDVAPLSSSCPVTV